MLFDSGRLYFAGRFGTADGRAHLAAIDADTGAGASGRPGSVPAYGERLARVGPAIVLTSPGLRAQSFDAITAAPIAFNPPVYGDIYTTAPAPEGAVIGGNFNGIGGVPRAGLAAVNLDTYEIEPWTSSLTTSAGFVSVMQVETDGTWLFVRTR